MMTAPHLYLISTLLLLLPVIALGEGDCAGDSGGHDWEKVQHLKIAAFFSILASGGLGVCIPILGKRARWLRPEGDVFFVVKAFAGGVILATGFIHILPDAFERLTSPCLSPSPWQDFPFAGFTAMVAAIGTLMIDTVATGFFNRLHYRNSASVAATGDDVGASSSTAPGHADVEDDGAHGADKHSGHVHMHSHATHGHAHGYLEEGGGELIRHRVIAQVFELGIIVHSVIIGISVGASESASVIRPLMVALCFHQFFEGVGLGGCIVQAKFQSKSIVVMGLFFSLTAPIGIGIGMGMSSAYNENSPTALIVEGLLDSASAGILIYMSLVDLLAHDFMNSRVQSKAKLQVAVNASLLLGAGLMSLIAKWA